MNQKLARLLSQMSYGAEVAGDGQQAIDALERDDYDVVLMDVQMPDWMGMGDARIRARWPDRQLQIVAMTANAMAGDREACLAAGMDDYISKPIRPADLTAALERVQSGPAQPDGHRPRRRPRRKERRMSDADAPVLDEASRRGAESTGDDIGFIRELVQTYLDDAPAQLADDNRHRGR